MQEVPIEVTCPYQNVKDALPYFRKFTQEGDITTRELTSVDQWAVESVYVWPQIDGKDNVEVPAVGAKQLHRPSFCGWAAAYSPHVPSKLQSPLRMYTVLLEDLDTVSRDTYERVAKTPSTLLTSSGSVVRQFNIQNLRSAGAFDYDKEHHVLRSRQCETVVDAYRSWMHKHSLAVYDSTPASESHPDASDTDSLSASSSSDESSARSASSSSDELSAVSAAAADGQTMFKEQQHGWPARGRGPWLLLEAQELQELLAHCTQLLELYLAGRHLPLIDATDRKIAVCLYDIVSTMWSYYEHCDPDRAGMIKPHVVVPSVEEAWLYACRRHSEWMVLAAYTVPNVELPREDKERLLNVVGPCECMPRFVATSTDEDFVSEKFERKTDMEVWLDPQQSLDSRLRADAESTGYTGTRHCPDPVATSSYLAGCGWFLPGQQYFAQIVTADGCLHCQSLFSWFSRVQATKSKKKQKLLCKVGQHFLLHSIWSFTAMLLDSEGEDQEATVKTNPIILHAHTLNDIFVRSTSTSRQEVACTIEIGGVGLAKARQDVMKRVLNSFDYWTLCLERAGVPHISDQLCHAYEFQQKVSGGADGAPVMAAGSTTMMWTWLRSHTTKLKLQQLLHSDANMLLVARESDTDGGALRETVDTVDAMMEAIASVGEISDAEDSHVALWSYLPLLLELSMAIELCKVDLASKLVQPLAELLEEWYGIVLREHPKHVRACARMVLLMGTAAEVEQNTLCRRAAAHVKQLSQRAISDIMQEVHNKAIAKVKDYVLRPEDGVVKLDKVCYTNADIHAVCTGS